MLEKEILLIHLFNLILLLKLQLFGNYVFVNTFKTKEVFLKEKQILIRRLGMFKNKMSYYSSYYLLISQNTCDFFFYFHEYIVDIFYFYVT